MFTVGESEADYILKLANDLVKETASAADWMHANGAVGSPEWENTETARCHAQFLLEKLRAGMVKTARRAA